MKKNPGTEDALFPDSEEEVLLEKAKSATLFTLSTAKQSNGSFRENPTFSNKSFAFICVAYPNWSINGDKFMKVNGYKEIGLRSFGRFFTITHFMQDKTHLQIGSKMLPNAVRINQL